MGNIEEKFMNIVVDLLGVDHSDVVPHASFVDDLGADFLDQVEIVMECEEEFSLNIPDEDADKIATVGGAVKYLEQHTK